MSIATNPADITLVETLRLAVPLHIADMRHLTPQQRMTIATRCAQEMSTRGDLLMFADPKRQAKKQRTGGRLSSRERETRDTFSALARGLACLAYQPGGATFAGLHWCAQNPGGVAAGECDCDREHPVASTPERTNQ